MKTIPPHRATGKWAGLVLFLLTGPAMAHPGHGGFGILHHLPCGFEVFLAVLAGWLVFHLGSGNSRA
jgi:hypothetical protein